MPRQGNQPTSNHPDPESEGLTRRTFVGSAAAAIIAPQITHAVFANEATTPTTPNAPLADYAHRPDASTSFELVSSGVSAGGDWLTGRLTSQVWQGVEWFHELSLFRPTHVATRGPMLLWIDGGSSGELPRKGNREPSNALHKLAQVAIASEMPAAVVRQVPFQPMFDGLVEDALIAHSFEAFVRTGDPTWPLLLPMVKTAIEAMNASEKVANSHWGLSVEGFVTTGASKRGWTTWLSAAMDDRVIGLVPAVIDMLSIADHVALQQTSFGGMSEKLVDYTSRGIDRLMASPRGRDLVAIVDPLAYRDRLPQPKLIALGANDPYWPIEASGLYYDKLKGPRWISYAPNAGHALPADRLGGLVTAMGRHAAGLEELPEVVWSIENDAGGKSCRVESRGADVSKAIAWTASSPTRDFRLALWHSAPAAPDGTGWRLPLAPPPDGFTAGFIELHFQRRRLPLMLTSGVAVVGA